MIDRESIFGDEEVVALLSEKFVPLAVDQHTERRRQDVEGEFFRKVLEQAGRRPDGYAQGLYAFSADGTLLEFSNTLSNQHAKRLMRSALAKFDPEAEIPAIEESPKKDTRYAHEPPEGAAVVEVSSKVIGGFPFGSGRGFQAITAEAMGRDRMWVPREEVAALAEGNLPRSLQLRLARFHLVDNTRNEPLFWGERDVREVELKLVAGDLTGRVHLETQRNDRGYVADVRGVVKAGPEGLETFDVVAEGRFWGRGGVNDRGSGGEKYPFAVSFRISTLQCEAAKVAPGACRGGGIRRYLEL